MMNYTLASRAQLAPLTEEQLRARAPSVFAADKHESRSERYAYIPTIDVLRVLQSHGFQVVAAFQGQSRIPGKAEFTKHLITLRHPDLTRMDKVGDTIPQINLLNSHDGTSAYRMFAGMYRLVCLNGLMVSDSLLEDVRVAHKGNVTQNVAEGAHVILDGFTRVIESKDTMAQIALSDKESQVFARAALALRWDEVNEGGEHQRGQNGTVSLAPIAAQSLLRARRPDDIRADLWTTFNRVQENLIRGGLRGYNANNQRTTTREVRSIDQNVKINRALWNLAEGMKALKTGVLSPEELQRAAA